MHFLSVIDTFKHDQKKSQDVIPFPSKIIRCYFFYFSEMLFVGRVRGLTSASVRMYRKTILKSKWKIFTFYFISN